MKIISEKSFETKLEILFWNLFNTIFLEFVRHSENYYSFEDIKLKFLIDWTLLLDEQSLTIFFVNFLILIQVISYTQNS